MIFFCSIYSNIEIPYVCLTCHANPRFYSSIANIFALMFKFNIYLDIKLNRIYGTLCKFIESTGNLFYLFI